MDDGGVHIGIKGDFRGGFFPSHLWLHYPYPFNPDRFLIHEWINCYCRPVFRITSLEILYRVTAQAIIYIRYACGGLPAMTFAPAPQQCTGHVA